MFRTYFILLILTCAVSCKKTSSTGNNSSGNNSSGNDTSVAVTAIGTPNGNPVTKTVGVAGGTISSADGRMDLIIPPGALSSDLAITIQPITNECPGGLGAGYDFLPNGTKFSTPATLVFHYTDSDVNGTDPDLIYYATQDSSQAWGVDIEKDVDTVAKTISFNVHHFSGKGFLAGIIITPAGGKLDYQQGENGILTVVQHVTDPELAGDPQSSDEDYLPPLSVNKPIPNQQITSWTVVGGSQNGTISGSGNQVTYTAPSKISTEKTIQVSATVKKTIVSKSRKQVMISFTQKTLLIKLNLHPPVLSFSVQLDDTIINTSTFYNDIYHDGASFQVDIRSVTVTVSKIINQAPTVTPPYGSGGDGTAATWIPDLIGITNITGVNLAIAYDTTLGTKMVVIDFTQNATVTPSWAINSPTNGKFTVDSVPIPGFPTSLIFTTSNATQTVTLSQLFGTGSPIRATFVITPIH
jgi:hypothetical protein